MSSLLKEVFSNMIIGLIKVDMFIADIWPIPDTYENVPILVMHSSESGYFSINEIWAIIISALETTIIILSDDNEML